MSDKKDSQTNLPVAQTQHAVIEPARSTTALGAYLRDRISRALYKRHSEALDAKSNAYNASARLADSMLNHDRALTRLDDVDKYIAVDRKELSNNQLRLDEEELRLQKKIESARKAREKNIKKRL